MAEYVKACRRWWIWEINFLAADLTDKSGWNEGDEEETDGSTEWEEPFDRPFD